MIKIGYPCLNYSLDGRANKTFKLASYSKERFIETVSNNIAYLRAILEFNREHDLRFFRISSDIIPFASHPVLDVDWQKMFGGQLAEIGKFIEAQGMRISMHPDQFVLINSPQERVVEAAVKDLVWHARLLDLLGLDSRAKVQIHVGGVYGEREAAIQRFIQNYRSLPKLVKDRLAIENDDRSYPLSDCVKIHEAVGVPIIFDVFHHECLNRGEDMAGALARAAKTWGPKDGVMMVDYATQQAGAVKGRHADSIDEKLFKDFLRSVKGMELDVMLEIKDKEKSALKALALYKELF